MPKSRFVQIDIPTPCSQSWDEMTTSGNGRFCGECQKTVIDFTTWSDADLHKFFAKNTDHVCGRYLSTQVARPIYIPHQPHSRLYKMTIALGLIVFFTQTPQLQAQTRPPKIAQTDTSLKVKPVESGFGQISGRVFDDKKEPLPSAVVQVSQNGVVKGGAATDFDGNYIIKPVEAGYYNLVITYHRLYSFIITGILVHPQEMTNINATLKSSNSGKMVTVQNYKLMGLVNTDAKIITSTKILMTEKKHRRKKRKHINTEAEPAKND